MPNVRLNMNFINPDKKIFRVYSGRNRRFFKQFEESGLAFLEIPDADFSAGFDDEELVRRIVRRSRSMLDALAVNTDIDPLFFPLNSFSGAANAEDRSGNSLIGSVVSLYRDAKVGDLVISPGRGPFREILYGEITAPFRQEDTITVQQFGDFEVPARRVRWFKKTPQEQTVPFELGSYIMGRKAVQSIKPADHALQFFDIAYGSYTFDDVSRLMVGAPNYDVDKFLATTTLNSTIARLLSAVVAMEIGQLDRFLELSPRDAARKYLTPEILEYYRLNFNSPGQISFKSKLMVLGPIVAVALALGAAHSLTNVVDGEDVVVESASASEDVCEQLSASMAEFARSLGRDFCRDLENSASEAKEEIGLTIPATVVDDE